MNRIIGCCVGLAIAGSYFVSAPNHKVILPPPITMSETIKCNKVKPSYKALLVIEESTIYWKMKDKKNYCFKERRKTND
jgi:hypothetical protein